MDLSPFLGMIRGKNDVLSSIAKEKVCNTASGFAKSGSKNKPDDTCKAYLS
jgi:hypothetical protein